MCVCVCVCVTETLMGVCEGGHPPHPRPPPPLFVFWFFVFFGFWFSKDLEEFNKEFQKPKMKKVDFCFFGVLDYWPKYK